MGQRAAVEQVKDLDHHHHVQRHRAGCVQAGPIRQLPLIQPKGGHQDQCAHDHHAPQQLWGQDGGARVARTAAHDALFLVLQRQHHAQCSAGGHIDPQDLNGHDRQGNPQQQRRQDDQALPQVDGQRPGDDLGQVIEDAAPFLDRGLNGGKVVIRQHHVGRLLGHLGARHAHRHADIRLLEGWPIVDAVARHGHHMFAHLQRFHQAQLLLRRDPRENRRALGRLDQLLIGQRGEFFARQYGQLAGLRVALALHPDLGGDGCRRQGVVAGDHLDLDAGALAGSHRGHRLGPRRVNHALQAQEGQAGFQVFVGQVFG